LKRFFSPFLDASNATKITGISFKMNKNMAYGSEGGENVRFKHKKTIFVL
jgi:hypothetical protein